MEQLARLLVFLKLLEINMTLQQITEDSEAIPGRQYLLHLEDKKTKKQIWTLGLYINGTLMATPDFNFGFKRLAIYMLPDGETQFRENELVVNGEVVAIQG